MITTPSVIVSRDGMEFIREKFYPEMPGPVKCIKISGLTIIASPFLEGDFSYYIDVCGHPHKLEIRVEE